MSNYRGYQENNKQMLTTSTRLYLLNESSNPVFILYKSSADAAVLVISWLISSRSGKGLVTSFAAWPRCASSETRFSLPRAHPDYFFAGCLQIVSPTQYSQCSSSSIALHQVKAKLLFATCTVDETTTAIHAIMVSDLAVMKACGWRMH